MNSNTDTLKGISILVTRPAGQATDLCSMIRQRGGAAIEYPLFDIRPVTDNTRILEIAGSLHQFNVVIFVSRNAVQFGLPFFRDPLQRT